LKVLNRLEETPLILGKEVEALMLNQLTSDLKSDLITPCVDERHGDIIDEDSHLLSSWRSEGLDLFLLNFSLDGLLEVEWSGGTGEIDSLVEHDFGIELAAVHLADGCLGCTWRSNK
jgi:hypothetical protein